MKAFEQFVDTSPVLVHEMDNALPDLGISLRYSYSDLG